ncbi:MAG: fmt [Acidimicrobiales bacterium]|nr:fmt [Acidimicrobiales bacterium]
MAARVPARPRRIVYLGTPEVAVPPLEALLDAGFEIPLVVTRPDKRRGRRGAATPSPVKVAALDRGLTVSHDVDDALGVGAEAGVVVAFGRIIKPHVLDRLPMVNLHFSLLPRWRGAAPVERAILAGDTATGVCVMDVAEELDTGDVYARHEVTIRRGSTADQLRAQLVEVGSRLLVETLLDGPGEPQPQVGVATYAEKLSPADLFLDWRRSADELSRVVRVGGAWTTYRGRRLKVHAAVALPADLGAGQPGELHGDQVTTGGGVLQLVEVQPEGRGRVRFVDWCNGAHPVDGEILGHGATAAAPA